MGAVESLLTYPHSLSFFNVLVGPQVAGEHLTDSNIDWGQDFLFLKRWLACHPDCRPLYVIDSASYPLEPLAIGVGEDSVIGLAASPESQLIQPYPGWYAVSVNQLYHHGKRYSHFLRFKPVAMVGYSIYVYDIAVEQANRVRRELGLPELTQKCGNSPEFLRPNSDTYGVPEIPPQRGGPEGTSPFSPRLRIVTKLARSRHPGLRHA
jgi:hypothetical protein